MIDGRRRRASIRDVRASTTSATASGPPAIRATIADVLSIRSRAPSIVRGAEVVKVRPLSKKPSVDRLTGSGAAMKDRRATSVSRASDARTFSISSGYQAVVEVRVGTDSMVASSPAGPNTVPENTGGASPSCLSPCSRASGRWRQ
jgi:hypothetical protein